jgi:hypothetical protein
LHLLEEVQLEPQDTSSGGEDNDILSRDINSDMLPVIESSAVNPVEKFKDIIQRC